MKTKKLLGFTLIELLIVIAIIGILAVAFLPSIMGAPAKARDTQRLAHVKKIETFLVSKMLTSSTTLPASACINSSDTDTASIGYLINSNLPDFGGAFPKDPQADNVMVGAPCTTTQLYGYVKFTQTSKKYTTAVYAAVENKENANIACSSIKSDTDPVLVAPSAITVGTTTDACYITLIQ